MTFRPRAKKDLLTYRFYEALILLSTLKRQQGARINEEPVEDFSSDKKKWRRRVLHNICIVADYNKGGDTVTSMLLQETPAGPIYWVCAAPDACEKIEPFLQKILGDLENTVKSRSNDSVRLLALENHLFRQFTGFDRRRLLKTRYLLRRELEKALETLTSLPEGGRKDLERLLEYLLEEVADAGDITEQCRKAYDAAKGPQLRAAYRPENSSHVKLPAECLVRHYLGRMASTLYTAKTLVQAVRHIPEMFESFQIKAIVSGPPKDMPPWDGGLTMERITKRMLPANSPDLPSLRSALARLDERLHTMDKFRETWEAPNQKLNVHAEVALLEAAYGARVEFYEDDRYIACSKGACFCCYYYIAHHPGRYVRPACHNVVWPKWRAPDMPDPEDDGSKMHQRDIMNKVIHDVRAFAIDKALRQSGPSRAHPDSTTGLMSITASAAHSHTDPTFTETIQAGSNRTESTLTGPTPLEHPALVMYRQAQRAPTLRNKNMDELKDDSSETDGDLYSQESETSSEDGDSDEDGDPNDNGVSILTSGMLGMAVNST